MSSDVAAARTRAITIITEYLQSDANASDVCGTICSEIELEYHQLADVLWTFLTLCKTSTTFGADSLTKLRLLLGELIETRPDLVPTVLCIFDPADVRGISVSPSDQKQYAIHLRKIIKDGEIPTWSSPAENPEGYARLLTALLHKNDTDLVRVIGEHNLDVHTVLNVMSDLIGIAEAGKFENNIHLFSVDHIVDKLMSTIGNDYKLEYNNILNMVTERAFADDASRAAIIPKLDLYLDKVFKWVEAAATKFCNELRKPRTILKFPGEEKYASYPSVFNAARLMYQKSVNVLHGMPQFRHLVANLSIENITNLAKYDPCMLPEVADFVMNYLREEYEANREEFLTEHNIMLLCMLSCRCSDNRFLVEITRLCVEKPEILQNSPCLISHFMMPALAADHNKCSSQLSPFIKHVMDQLSLTQRCQILDKYAECTTKIIDLRIITAKAEGKINNVCKRLTKESAPKHADTVAKVILRAPHIVTAKLIQCLFDDQNKCKEVPVMALENSWPLGIDFMLCCVVKTIRDMYVPSNERSEVPRWPDFFADFVGLLMSVKYDEIDISGFLHFIESELKKFSVTGVCFICGLITEMTKASYKGDLRADEIEMRCGLKQKLLTMRALLTEDKKDSGVKDRIYKLKEVMEKDDLGLRILRLIDLVYNKIVSSDDLDCTSHVKDVSNTLDDIRFTFLTFCEGIGYSNLKVRHLIDEYQFDIATAFHLARGNTDEDLESFAPDGIHPSLYITFWNKDMASFYVPGEQFLELEKMFDAKIEEMVKRGDEEGSDCMSLYKDDLVMTHKRQVELVESLRENLRGTDEVWFDTDQYPHVYTLLITKCILPRARISLMDSLYCVKFIEIMMNTFSTFRVDCLLDRLFACIHFIILSSTTEEARTFARMVNKVFKLIDSLVPEKERMHGCLMDKMELLLVRSESFLICNTVYFLSIQIDVFPEYDCHLERMSELLSKIETTKGSDVHLVLARYKGDIRRKINDKHRANEAPPAVEAAISKSISTVAFPKKQTEDTSHHSDDEAKPKESSRDVMRSRERDHMLSHSSRTRSPPRSREYTPRSYERGRSPPRSREYSPVRYRHERDGRWR